MRRNSSGISSATAIDGFHKFKVVEGLSERTMAGYTSKLSRFAHYLDDPPFSQITAADTEDFLYWLRREYRAKRLNGENVRCVRQEGLQLLGGAQIVLKLGTQTWVRGPRSNDSRWRMGRTREKSRVRPIDLRRRVPR